MYVCMCVFQLKANFAQLGFDPNMVSLLLNAMAGILHLGQIEFTATVELAGGAYCMYVCMCVWKKCMYVCMGVKRMYVCVLLEGVP